MYQSNYIPCSLSPEVIKNIVSYRYESEANAEVKRVAFNMFNALQNHETPKIVKTHIRKYFVEYSNFENTKYLEVIELLYSIHCRQISRIPFVPDRQYIEDLTGNDKEKAVQAAKEVQKEKDFILFKQISESKVREFTETMLESNTDPYILAALVSGICERPKLLDLLIEICFDETVRYSKEYWDFMKKISNPSKLEVS